MKAFTVSHTAKVFAYTEPVHMARSFDGLSEIIVKKLKKKPESGDLYLFVNTKKTYVKVLFWSKGGFCIFAKRLDKAIFDTDSMDGSLSITSLEKLVDEVIVHGGKKLRHLKAVPGKAA